MDTIRKGPAILSTCVKRWRLFACKVGFLLQDRTKFGMAGLFRLTEHAKAVYELFFILSPWRPMLTRLRQSYCKSRIFCRHVIFVYFVRSGFRTKIKCIPKVQSKSENPQRSATVRKFHAYERPESPGYEN